MTTKQDAMEAAGLAVRDAVTRVVEQDVRAWEMTPSEHQSLAQAAVTAYLAAREAEGPTAKQVEAVAKLLRNEGYSGDSYRTARHAIHLVLAARPTNGDS